MIAAYNKTIRRQSSGVTCLVQLKDHRLYAEADEHNKPSIIRTLTVEIGAVGDERKYETLTAHGLIPEETNGAMFSGRINPLGGYDLGKFIPCIKAMLQQDLATYFTNLRPEIESVNAGHSFGATIGRQAISAIVITIKVPDAQALLKLPNNVTMPTGKFDHASHYPTAGQVPQFEQSGVTWYLQGYK